MTLRRAVSNPESAIPNPGSVRILGIDPGSQRTGVGIVDIDTGGRTTHVFHTALNLLDNDSFPLRLKQIFDELCAIVAEHRPDEVAIERVFMARNPDSALKLGHARGAAICAVVNRGLPVAEYSAKEIKQSVVGGGGAEKRQVQHMVSILLNIERKLQADAADALAVALTHAHARESAQRLHASAPLAALVRTRGSASSWRSWR
ncbi:MAG: crossover junction endodeoxyribonuclease RuvC [Rudaea sp.]|uniref:crossover junction endodeoxyribonuclease RuvC n=1 Tax=unclassified Rudaea TaxID=2627037 RepID=UPI0010F9FF7B|nr:MULTISPECIES: crossover junction endodeoxyribonuclease RuvC [unclassified Rudaea]MBN8886513.1 crossover junction endodeoxyribonuclease RuvC [Rudaea sp.]